MHAALFAALLSVAGPQETAPAPEPPRFQAGARAKLSLVHDLELEVETRLESRSEKGQSRITTTLEIDLAILAVDAEGGATLAITLERIGAEIADASGRTRWDSMSGRAEPPDSPRADLLAELARLVGARLEVDLDRHQRLIARRGTEVLAARLGIAANGAALAPLFPWIWAAFPRDGRREEIELALSVEATAADAAAAPAAEAVKGPRLRATLQRGTPEAPRGESASDAIVELVVSPRETRAPLGSRRSLECRGRFAFDASTGLLLRGELESVGVGSREAWLDPGRPLQVASTNRAKARLTWRRVGS